MGLGNYRHLTVAERARQGITDTWAAAHVCEYDVPALLAERDAALRDAQSLSSALAHVLATYNATIEAGDVLAEYPCGEYAEAVDRSITAFNEARDAASVALMEWSEIKATYR